MKVEEPETKSQKVGKDGHAQAEHYLKTAAEILESTQMVAYLVQTGNVNPHIDRGRLSHIYYATRGPKAARKVTGILHLADARRHWQDEIEPVVREMKDVAKAKSIAEVD